MALLLVGASSRRNSQDEMEAAMPQPQISRPLAPALQSASVAGPPGPSRSSTELESLGEIDVAGHLAAVTWPWGGDAVGIDFLTRPSRFGIVVGLASDPRLRVEPDHADLLDLEGRLAVLEQVGALWYRAVAGPERSVP
ncbi:hypothetical protein [Glycomyces sp. NPDC021274]|uniref:hypothetical protein n=1 Tax=Glycomyces sp. NPDC021274 TaxID=3155120 RepID=UPI0033D2D12E